MLECATVACAMFQYGIEQAILRRCDRVPSDLACTHTEGEQYVVQGRFEVMPLSCVQQQGPARRVAGVDKNLAPWQWQSIYHFTVGGQVEDSRAYQLTCIRFRGRAMSAATSSSALRAKALPGQAGQGTTMALSVSLRTPIT